MRKSMRVRIALVALLWGSQAMAEPAKPGTPKPEAWVGCYESRGTSMEGNATRNTIEVRQEGGTLYIPAGMEGRRETRLILRPATPHDLRAFKEALGPSASGVELTRGLVVAGTSLGDDVKMEDAGRLPLMGLYGIREGGKEALYLVAPLTFDKTTKMTCK